MSGGVNVPLPIWLAEAKDAMDAVMSLRRSSRKSDIHDAQRKVADFESVAKADWYAHNRLKDGLVRFVMAQPELAARIHELHEFNLKIEAAKKSGKYDAGRHADFHAGAGS